MPESPLNYQVERTAEGHFVKANPATPSASRQGAETTRRASPRPCSTAKSRR
jgi:hypothetical protein